MTNHEFDLDHMVEMEIYNTPEIHLIGQTDQYGLDIEGLAYLEQEDLWEVDEAIDNIQKRPNFEQPRITPMKDDQIGRASCRKECRSRWSPYH